MIHANQHVPTPTPIELAGFGTPGDGSTGGKTGPSHRDGIVFMSEVRDQTGAGTHPAGSASGVYLSDIFFNPAADGLRLFTSLSTGASTGTVTIQVQVQDPASNTWFDLTGAATAAITGPTGSAMLTIHPALTSGANATISQCLGPVWRLKATVANAPATFQVGADYLI